MSEHLQLEDMPEFCTAIKTWLNDHYPQEEAEHIWQATSRQYEQYLTELPDYGGKKNTHAAGIYGSVLIFSLYPQLPDHPPVEELQEFVPEMFMASFVGLGKIFNLNRGADMWLIDKVFHMVGRKDQKEYAQYPATFCNVSEPYDKKHHATRYRYTHCPNAAFAQKHDLLHVLPLFCNADYWGIGKLHGTLIRRGTCGNSDCCDYCVVGSKNPLAQEYEIVKDEKGFLVSRKIQK